jgi:hypothetical protein
VLGLPMFSERMLHFSAAIQVDIFDILETAVCELCDEISLPNDNFAICSQATTWLSSFYYFVL